MSYITEIDGDGELNTALANFNSAAVLNSIVLGLSPANLLEIAAASSTFTTNFNASTVAKATAKSAIQSKDLQKKASKAVVSKWAKTFRANPAVPDNVLDQLMLPHHKTPGTKTPPTQPMNLFGNADGNGLVSLKWNRNGNTNGTQFQVETRTDPAGAWTIAGGTTTVKFTYQAVAGSYIAFRVTATRRGLTSPASVPFALWESGGAVQLQVAA